eukprot:SAG11_NODE_29271_length_312_cov_2.117371_1_plen_21_part_01
MDFQMDASLEERVVATELASR